MESKPAPRPHLPTKLIPKKKVPVCQDCRKADATCTFRHLDGRIFSLCDRCFGWADHEEDYGADFHLVPCQGCGKRVVAVGDRGQYTPNGYYCSRTCAYS